MKGPAGPGFRCSGEQLLRRIVKRFRGGPVFKAHRLFVSLNSRLENDQEEEGWGLGSWVEGLESRIEGSGCGFRFSVFG